MTAATTGVATTRLGAIRFVRTGRGRALLLLHGNGQSWREFEDSLDEFSRRFDVIAWDMPGHGKSEDVHSQPTIEDYAAALADLVQVLGLSRPVICGSSVGAFIAAAYSAASREVSALIMSELNLQPWTWWCERWAIVERMFAEPIQSRQEVQARFERTVDDALLARWNEDRDRVGGAGMLAVMAAIRDFDPRPALARLAAPRLWMFGATGPALDGLRNLAAALPDPADVVVVPRSGHFISVDQPNRFAAVVSGFVEAALRGGVS